MTVPSSFTREIRDLLRNLVASSARKSEFVDVRIAEKSAAAAARIKRENARLKHLRANGAPTGYVVHGAALLAAIGFVRSYAQDSTVRGVAEVLIAWADTPGVSEDMVLELSEHRPPATEYHVEDFLVGFTSADHLVDAFEVLAGFPRPIRHAVLKLLHSSSPCSVCGAPSVGDAGRRSGGNARPSSGQVSGGAA